MALPLVGLAARAALGGFRVARGVSMYQRLRGSTKRARGNTGVGGVTLEMRVDVSDIAASLENFEGKIRRYALERSFNDSERMLATETLRAVRAVPRTSKRKTKKVAEGTRGWIRIRSGLTKSKFKKRVIGKSKKGAFTMRQGISGVPVHWIEYGTYGGAKWPGYPVGSGPRYGTYEKMKRQIVADVARRLRKQVESFKATGKLKTAKALRQ